MEAHRRFSTRIFKTPYRALKLILGCICVFTYLALSPSSFKNGLATNFTKTQQNPFAMFTQCKTAGAVFNKSAGVQLSDIQIMWIADTLHMVYSINNKRPSMLIFGLGNDSPLWETVNCNGRTVFVEDDVEWITTVSTKSPSLEIHHLEYNSRVEHALEFLENPVEIKIDDSVDTECFDVVLIDAPKGYAPDHPGRMIPAYYTSQNARKCKTASVVFLHDVGRQVEQLIAEHYFPEQDGWVNLGNTEGPSGLLTGWVLLK
jgi:hypothetical protein